MYLQTGDERQWLVHQRRSMERETVSRPTKTRSAWEGQRTKEGTATQESFGIPNGAFARASTSRILALLRSGLAEVGLWNRRSATT